MVDFIRPVLARIVGAVVAGVLTWLATKFGVVIPKETAGQLTENLVAAMLVMFSIIYALVHRAVSVKTNPTDAAQPDLARRGTPGNASVAGNP